MNVIFYGINELMLEPQKFHKKVAFMRQLY